MNPPRLRDDCVRSQKMQAPPHRANGRGLADQMGSTMRDASPLCAVCDADTLPGAPLPLCSRCIARTYRFAHDCRGANLCSLCDEPIGVDRPPLPICPPCARKVYEWVGTFSPRPGRPERVLDPAAVLAGTQEIVYYVLFGDRVKIGTTVNLANRLRGIPHDRVLAFEPGGRDVEQLRHDQFTADHIKGEWFRLSPALAAHIERVAEKIAPAA